MRRLALLMGSLALVACQATDPSTSGTSIHVVSLPSKAPAQDTSRPLAHEGGIVFAKPLDTISDPVRQAAATQLGTELGLDLQASRAMRDAELLASSTGNGYALLADVAATAAEQARSDAQSAFEKLTPDQQLEVRLRIADMQARVRSKVASQLEQHATRFTQQGSDQTSQTTDGNTAITRAFAEAVTGGSRDVAVTRTLDPHGNLLQSQVRLGGMASGVPIDGLQTSTAQPDGGVVIVSDTRLTLDGSVRVVHWNKRVAHDGTIAAAGTISRADGSLVALTSSGAADGVETITGSEAAAGVSVELRADAAAATASATISAGNAGSALATVSTDDGSPVVAR